MALKIYFFHVLIIFIAASVVSGGNILFYPITGEGSHYYVAMKIAKELIGRGHNITVLLDDRYEDQVETHENRQSAALKYEFFKGNFTKVEYQDMLKSMTNAGLKGKYVEWAIDLMKTDMMDRQVSECLNLLGNEQLIANLRNANFDLAVVDFTVICPAAQYLGKPFVVLSPILALQSRMLVENRIPFNPSYMPEMTTANDHRMSFTLRLWNTAYSILVSGLVFLFFDPFREIRSQYMSPEFTEAELWLLNTHFVLDFPRPLLPNTVTVGGLSTGVAQPLSHDWEEFLQSAGEDGVVLFSMGSYATGIDEDVAAMFAEAFAQLPQKVIWKLNGKPSASLTPNVKVVEWMPQNDLLGHPQIKAFVYHCGMNGVWEAVYHGVPMVAVPLFGDQHDNAQRIVSRGMGVQVEIATLTSDILADAIREVISNPSYKETATRMSTIFRDTPRTPIEVAADSLEFVIRHKGAKHLRSAALDLNIFQYLLLDVILVLLAAFITFIIIIFCFCRLCFRGCRKICGSSSKVKRE